jgi:hypothetical protein
VSLRFNTYIDVPRYAFVCLMKNEDVAVHTSDQRLTGVLSICHNANKAVAKSATQTPPPGIGIDTFEFWTPRRRPAGANFAVKIDPPAGGFEAANVVNGVGRPVGQPNAWVADFADARPELTFTWDKPQRIASVELAFDSDFDHPMESVLMGHPEREMPFCVRNVEILSGGRVVGAVSGNHQTLRTVRFDPPLETAALTLRVAPPPEGAPAALFEVRCIAAG